MLCVYNGRVCYLKYNIARRRWVYIRQDDWDAMPREQKACYADAACMEDE